MPSVITSPKKTKEAKNKKERETKGDQRPKFLPPNPKLFRATPWCHEGDAMCL